MNRMADAPHDRPIIGIYDDGEILIQWSENRV